MPDDPKALTERNESGRTTVLGARSLRPRHPPRLPNTQTLLHRSLMHKRSLMLIPLLTACLTSCISMQPRRIRDAQDPAVPVEQIRIHLQSGEQFDLYDATVRADSIVGRTRLVPDAPLRAVATADVAQVQSPSVSALRTTALSALVFAGVIFTAAIVTLFVLLSSLR